MRKFLLCALLATSLGMFFSPGIAHAENTHRAVSGLRSHHLYVEDTVSPSISQEDVSMVVAQPAEEEVFSGWMIFFITLDGILLIALLFAFVRFSKKRKEFSEIKRNLEMMHTSLNDQLSGSTLTGEGVDYYLNIAQSELLHAGKRLLSATKLDDLEDVEDRLQQADEALRTAKRLSDSSLTTVFSGVVEDDTVEVYPAPISTTPRAYVARRRPANLLETRTIKGQTSHYYGGGYSPAGAYYSPGYYGGVGYYAGMEPWLLDNIILFESLDDVHDPDDHGHDYDQHPDDGQNGGVDNSTLITGAPEVDNREPDWGSSSGSRDTSTGLSSPSADTGSNKDSGSSSPSADTGGGWTSTSDTSSPSGAE